MPNSTTRIRTGPDDVKPADLSETRNFDSVVGPA